MSSKTFLFMMFKEQFFNYLIFEKRTSNHTVEAYKTDILQFEMFASSLFNLHDIAEADSDTIRTWIVNLLEHGISTRSVNRKISSLKAFYFYLIKIDVIKINPMEKVITPKTSKRLPVFLEVPTMDKLFSSEILFTDDFQGVRDRAIMEIFYATGMRRAELLGLKFSDIDFYEQTLKVLGKRNKERIIPFGKHLADILENYFNFYAQKWELNQNSCIFVSEKGVPLTSQSVSKIVHKYLDMITTVDKRSPHVLRHTFATHLLNQGADINAIKELLGHSSLAATQIYTHNTISKLKSIYNQAHPRAQK